RNNKKLCLFNGMQAIVSKVHRWNFFDIKTDDGKDFIKIKYLPEQFGKEKNDTRYDRDGPVPFDYAWCVTCHKAQGDEWQNIIVYEQMCDKWDHKMWAYTAASRAKNSLIWILGRPKASSVYVPDWLKESAA
ncbi:MAG: ATP-binding domain-containing protein, partial [Minisyncoccia bacterium]